MKNKLYLSIITIALFIVVFTLNTYSNDSVKVINTVNSTPTETNRIIETTKKITPDHKKHKEMKGLWVTYMELDMSDTDRSYTSFKSKFDIILKNAIDNGFNCLVVQVRPFSDALYESRYYPVSHILSGTQGKNCNYDALEYMCRKCHQNDIDIHAWINPFRIKTNKTPDVLSDDNPYIKDKSLGIETEDGIYYNPASKKARKLITDGVKEIVENYDIDGIQFDDYFYPTKDKSFDSEDYNSYLKSTKSNAMTLSQWRMNNVNLLIKNVYKAVHSANKDIVFGISPQGNIRNNKEIYADVKTWCSESGYIDYICPQLYYSLDNPALAYETAVNQWLKICKNKDIQIYSGLAGYKAGSNADEGTWEDFSDILKQEYLIAKEKKFSGIMLYSYNSLIEKSSKKEIKNLKSVLQ